MSKWQQILLVVIVAAMFGLGLYIWVTASDDETNSSTSQVSTADVPERLLVQFPEVDYSKTDINLDEVLSGGPGKDGIPAISDPNFESISQTATEDSVQGIYVNINEEERFYPYNILVWHEIVNDDVGGTPIAATFCPLCGSAVVYDRNVDGQVVDFGVSGFLWESNMIMYDRTDNPTFWSQSIGKGVVGDKTNQELGRVNFQLLDIGTVKSDFPDTLIMTTDTGYSRDYGRNPYSGYEDDNDLYFGVSADDNRFPAKEIFYAVALEDEAGNTTKYVAIRFNTMERGTTASDSESGLTITYKDNGEIEVSDSGGNVLPGYYEMWFSWATQHQDDGVVFDPSQN